MKTDWKDDIFTQRKIQLQDNGDGTVTPIDKTDYTQTGDAFGSKELNEIGTELNTLKDEVAATKKSVSDGKAEIAAAITLKKVATAATDTFAQMAANIKKIILGSGNAVAGDVRAGKTFTNSDGVQLTGTLVERGSPTYDLPINGTQKLDAGIYSGGEIKQKIPTMGKQTITPKASAQTVATANKYLTGDITVNAVSNLSAANIKKGVTVGGVTGTWEGWVATDGDLYNQGTFGRATGFTAIPDRVAGSGINWITTVTCSVTNEKGMVTLYGGYYNAVRTNNTIDLTGFSTLNVTMSSTKSGSNSTRISTSVEAPISMSSSQNNFDKTMSMSSGFGGSEKTLTLDISGISGKRYISFGHYVGSVSETKPHQSPYYSYIKRVWLS